MKFKLRTKEGIKEFEGSFNLITYDNYFDVFRRDLLVDAQQEVFVNEGMFGRAYLLRVMYSMIKTANASFMNFYDFLDYLEDDIIQFFEDLDQELLKLLTDKVTGKIDKALEDIENDVIANDKPKN